MQSHINSFSLLPFSRMETLQNQIRRYLSSSILFNHSAQVKLNKDHFLQIVLTYYIYAMWHNGQNKSITRINLIKGMPAVCLQVMWYYLFGFFGCTYVYRFNMWRFDRLNNSKGYFEIKGSYWLQTDFPQWLQRSNLLKSNNPEFREFIKNSSSHAVSVLVT